MLFRSELSQLLRLDPQSFILSGIEASFVILLVTCGYWLVKNSIIRMLKKSIDRTKNEQLKLISRNRVLRNFTLLVPVIMLYSFKHLFLNKTVVQIYEKFFYSASVIIMMMLFFSIANVLTEVYVRNEKVAERFPVKPIFQILKVIGFMVALIVIVANFVDKTPVYILSGLGAASAVLLFVFKDSIQSLVASFQITLHKSVKVGDWIEVPKYLVNGEVKDINLNMLSVLNFDNTTTVIPTNSLLTESFKNWETMHKTGRRIMRSIKIDVNSVRHLDVQQIDRLKKIKLLNEYLSEKQESIKQTNMGLEDDEFRSLNGRMLTNLGTFRKYIEMYLRNHPHIRQDQLLLVRQLDSSTCGIPLEVYAFTGNTKLVSFEEVQCNIFEHLYAVIGLFGLKVYQSPSGSDFAGNSTSSSRNAP
mgnify:CR=1 FL=1